MVKGERIVSVFREVMPSQSWQLKTPFLPVSFLFALRNSRVSGKKCDFPENCTFLNSTQKIRNMVISHGLSAKKRCFELDQTVCSKIAFKVGVRVFGPLPVETLSWHSYYVDGYSKLVCRILYCMLLYFIKIAWIFICRWEIGHAPNRAAVAAPVSFSS